MLGLARSAIVHIGIERGSMNNLPKPNQLVFNSNDDSFSTIYKQLERLSQKAEYSNDKEYWLELRSKIYIRDKAICWVCNEFVELPDYDLGHLIDRCMGGWDNYDNLVVMHTKCNLMKPRHQTLEDAMRWKLTPKNSLISITPRNNPHPSFNTTPTNNTQKPPQETTISKPRNNPIANYLKSLFKRPQLMPIQTVITPITPDILLEPIMTHKRTAKVRRICLPSRLTPDRIAKYNEQIKKIKPVTLCWVQGYPNGGAMWRVYPPPYKQEDAFIMRQTPPGATEPNGKKGIIESIQVIGGKLTTEIYLDVGITKLHIIPQDDKLSVTLCQTSKSNVGKREKTIGWGQGQIPIEEWKNAKAKGISFIDFIGGYRDNAR